MLEAHQKTETEKRLAASESVAVKTQILPDHQPRSDVAAGWQLHQISQHNHLATEPQIALVQQNLRNTFKRWLYQTIKRWEQNQY